MLKNEWVRRALLLLLAYALYLWSWQTAFSAQETSNTILIPFNGYLSREVLQSASQTLDKTQSNQTLVITINSNSGDLSHALELAKKIFQLKQEKHLHVAVYIEDNAIGPAAIFPLLADELYISSFISWGDIPYGNEKSFSTNILLNRVISLIDPKRPQAPLLQLIATGMTDPGTRIINDHGWRIAKEGEESASPVTMKGATLVVNHNQLSELGLIKDTISMDEFLSLYRVPSQKKQESTSPQVSQDLAEAPARLEQKLKEHIKFNTIAPNTVGHILIDDRSSGINQGTWLYVKKALDHYKETKPIFVILELNTPGGEVYAAQQISDALKELDTQYSIPVVAFINNWAMSAGAMLAYSSRFITVVKDGSMGAAEPVIQDTTGKMEAASEKINSAMRADFGNRARFFDRDPLLAEAMVDKDLLLVLRHGKIVKLDNESQIRTTGQDADVVISPKGKLLTLGADQLLEYGVADLIVPPTKTAPITSAEQESGKWPVNKLALFHLPFFNAIPNATIDSYRMDWKMKFFALLASPIVSSMLFMGLMLGLYLEFSTPGFGLPGTLAATCLFLIILSSFALEIANWLELILLLVGLGVILVELFVLPTFGLLGFIGVIFFLMGLFGMMLPGLNAVSFEFDTKTFNAAGQVVFERLAWLCGTLVVSFIIMAILSRYVTPQLAGFSRLVLKGNEQVGYIAGDNPTDLPPPGSKGEAAATLRPAGKVIINDTLYDAVSAGGFIERGTPIVVSRLDGSTIIVSAATEETKEQPTT